MKNNITQLNFKTVSDFNKAYKAIEQFRHRFDIGKIAELMELDSTVISQEICKAKSGRKKTTHNLPRLELIYLNALALATPRMEDYEEKKRVLLVKLNTT